MMVLQGGCDDRKIVDDTEPVMENKKMMAEQRSHSR
jgi:hypothetical protein